MGQGSSQPESGIAEQSERGTVAGSRRSRLGLSRRRQRSGDGAEGDDEGGRGPERGADADGDDNGESHMLDDGLLNSTDRSRPRASNRLSQMFRSSPDHAVSTTPQDRSPSSDQPRGALLDRTRTRIHDMLRREHHRTSSRPTPSFLQHHGSRSDRSLSPPRLPSIDLASSFDHPDDILHLQDMPEPQSAPRPESSQRRAGRLNVLRPDRPFRHLTSSLRRRRASPPPRTNRPRANEDQAEMLSRLLSVAAAATAATLMGDDHNALSGARSLTGSSGLGDIDLGAAGGEDGSFEGFLRALQNGRIASALRQGGTDGHVDGTGTPAAPLNFFRMFRFGASEAREVIVGDGSSESGAPEGRMVPIIIVGIRSISQNANSHSGPSGEDLPPFIDALNNFPTPLPAQALGAHGHDSIDSILRPPQNGTSFRHRRRASMGNFGMGRSRLSDRMDDQRDHRSPESRRERPWSVASTSSNYEPRPPPATPTSPSPELSRISSRSTTPNHSRPTSLVASSMRDFSNDSRRNSILHRASATSPLSSHTEETASIRSTHSGTGLLGDSEPFRIHRRSDTAPNIHYPRFASGHPRRNGVVEPDHLPSLSRTSSTTGTETSSNEHRNSSNDHRSWIIYVLGGSYPENHPILTTPSLFTENPTYEDMMLLSALLGPAKAPVATEEDVQSAGGIYTIDAVEMTGDVWAKTVRLVASAVEGEDRVLLETDQRCLVCLCEFEAKETGRKLVKCSHLFHKECIDQWLTTGRNSCPLCREQGVDEKKTEEADKETETAPAAGAELDAVETEREAVVA